MNPLLVLRDSGQSVWLDFITRRFMAEGGLQKLITQDGLGGVTSNPTIFEKAITGGTEYDADIQSMIRGGKTSPEIFDALALRDIQQACDLFRPVYDKTSGADGFVSIEVNPHLARDTEGTLAEARRLFRLVGRPNVMIKIPATPEGLPAIEKALGEGIHINITLIFSLDRYRQVVDAWLAGLEHAAAAGRPLASIASVASFFVSRVDSVIDADLEKKMAAAPDTTRDLSDLRGRAAITNARLAYDLFQKMIVTPRFKALEVKGARVQRPLWASTSTKSPRYRDVLYVEELIGPHTVNTLPPATIDAFRDHGKVRPSLVEGRSELEPLLARLVQAGIDMAAVTRRLEEDGVRLFSQSYDSLMLSLEKKRETLKAGTTA